MLSVKELKFVGKHHVYSQMSSPLITLIQEFAKLVHSDAKIDAGVLGSWNCRAEALGTSHQATPNIDSDACLFHGPFCHSSAGQSTVAMAKAGYR
jgi:hypothetical protein